MALKSRNIYKRKDGRYEARYIKDRTEQGKAIYASVYAQNYALVKEKLLNAKKKTYITPLAITPQQPVPFFLEAYLEKIKPHIKQSTYGVYQRYLENHISPHFKNIRCNRLNQEIIQNFVNRQIENGLSAMTVQSVFSFLKKGFEKVLSQNIFKEIKLPKVGPTETTALSISEQKFLESAARASGDINRLAITLCLYTGIRVGELCGLMWTDIDFERSLLHIRRTVQRIKNIVSENSKTPKISKTKLVFLSPKSASSQRNIPLPAFLLDMLKEYRIKAATEYVLSYNGRFIEPRNIQRRFKKLLIDAQLPDVNFHITRHTFATRALENGFDIKTLSEILGHSSPSITLRRYTHAMDEHKRRSMEALAALYLV